MIHRFCMVFALIALVQVACGSSSTPTLDVLPVDNNLPQDPGQQDTNVSGDLDRVDVAQPDTAQPDVPTVDDLDPADLAQPDTTPVDPGPAEVTDDVEADTFVPEDVVTVDLTPADLGPEVAPECVEDVDCAVKGDPSICHLFVCEAGACVEAAVEEGTACTDGEFCTAPDTCRSGVCVAGPAVTCDDGDICTTDSCVAGACLNLGDTSALTCGTGACYRETPRCTGGVLHSCQPGTPSAESCDGLDNDCDGTTDNGNLGGANCISPLAGPCAAGTTACQAGALVCVPKRQPTPETCDGLDNDCDGVVDNGDPNGGLRCPTGKLGACSIGTTACVNALVTCVQTVEPSVEMCDGQDNDCDGQVDEDNPGSGLACATGKAGVCNEGLTGCVNGATACIQVGQPSTEVCDGVDNDCDGAADPAGAAGCLPFLRDADGDSYGVTGDVQCLCAPTVPYTGTKEGDCCDLDDRSRPSVTTPVPALSRCGSFDYHCSGTPTQQYTYGTGSCGWWPLCQTTAGWLGATPGCGDAGEILTDCNFNGFSCDMITTKVTQGCL